MSADLHIHIFEGLAESDLAKFFGNTIGSKYFRGFSGVQMEWNDAALTKIHKTPDCWIGEVSWLKAAIFGDSETFVPNPVGEVSRIIGEDLPTIDDDLINKLRTAFNVKNQTEYLIAKWDEVETFLNEHKGKKAFTVSW